MGAQVGDRIIVESERVGVKAREGRIVEVIGTPADERYRVRWDDGHETVVYPHAGCARIEAAEREPQRVRSRPAREPQRVRSRPAREPAERVG